LGRNASGFISGGDNNHNNKTNQTPMNAPQTSVSAMFDSAFEGLAAPMAPVAPAFPQVAGFAGNPNSAPVATAAPPRKPIMKLALVVVATLGIAAALYLMFKKMKTNTKTKMKPKTQKRRKTADLDSDDDEENASDDDEDASDTKPAKPQKMTTFAPLDMPAVNFPVPLGPSQPQPQQPQNIRNSKGMRASEQIQGFPPPNIDVGLGSGTPPSMRPPATGNPAPQFSLPPPPPPSADQNFNPL